MANYKIIGTMENQSTNMQAYKGVEFEIVRQPAPEGRGHRDLGGYIPYVGGRYLPLVDRYDTEIEAIAAAKREIDSMKRAIVSASFQLPS